MISTKFNLYESLKSLRSLAEKTPYKDGYHLGLKKTEFLDSELAIEKEFGEVLFSEVVKTKPKNILELGTANGYSTCWFLLGLIKNKSGEIITVDTVDRYPKVWEILEIPNLRIIEYHDSTERFSQEYIGLLDMVLFDTEHTIEKVIADIESIFPFLKKKATLFIHDTFGNPEMGKQLRAYFEKREDFDYESIDKSCGLGIARRKK